MSNTLSVNFPSVNFMLKFGLILFGITSSLLLMLYVLQIGDLIGKSYAVRNYEIQIQEALNQDAVLNSDSTESNSLQTLEQKVNNLNFVKANQIRYIPIYSKQLVSNVK